jgi:ABC-2 type transport system ATP-binding protein
MQHIISVQGLSKSYASGFQALKGVNLNIRQGPTAQARPR